MKFIAIRKKVLLPITICLLLAFSTSDLAFGIPVTSPSTAEPYWDSSRMYWYQDALAPPLFVNLNYSASVKWSSQASTYFKFDKLGTLPHIRVYMNGDGWNMVGGGNLGAQTTKLAEARVLYGDYSHTIYECDIVRNLDKNWSPNPNAALGEYDIESVMLHEFGHCLGLAHTGVPSAVMYEEIGPGVIKRNLTTDDMNRISEKYPASAWIPGLN